MIRCLSPLDAERPLFHNELIVRGVVAARGIGGLLVTVDGTTHPAHLLPASPEAAAEFPKLREGERSEFGLRLKTSDFRPGVHGITVRASDQHGTEAVWERDVEILPYRSPPASPEKMAEVIAAGHTAMWLQQPAAGVCLPGNQYFSVSGWAHCPTGIDAVFVSIDDELVYDANHSLRRPDLNGVIPGADLGRSGFALRIDPRTIAPGEHRIRVVALGADGTAMGVEWPFEIAKPGSRRDEPPVPEPAGELDEAQFLIQAPGAKAPGGTERTPAERFIPDQDRGYLMEAEHQARYRLAAQLAPGRVALDAGCGLGYGTAILGRAGASRAVGIDIDAQTILAAREQFSDGAELVIGDLHEMPFADGSFDLVTCFEAIEHATDAERVLDELRRVLRDGGLLLLSSPNRLVYPPGNPWHTYEFTPEELEAALGSRFANVRLYRQRSQIGTMICDDERFAIGDPGLDLATPVHKLRAGAPGEELYTIALAGNGPLPPLEPIAIFTDQDFDVMAWHDLAAAWQERAMWLEAEAAADRAEAHATYLDYDRLQEHVAGIKASLSWRMTKPLRAVKRGIRSARRTGDD